MTLCPKHYDRLKHHGTTDLLISKEPIKYNYEEVIGNTYGDLTVISKNTDNKHVTLLCKCSCGNNTNVRIEYLFKKGRRTCGKCSYNKFEIKGDYVIGFTTTQKEFYFDLEDYNRVKEYTWRIAKEVPITTINKKTIMLHKFILNYFEEDKDIDHIDGNPSNNRKNNLRICTHQENGFNQKIRKNNTSGVTGVWYNNSRDNWVAEIKVDQHKYTKSFNKMEDAIKKRIDFEFQYFGDFRRGQLDTTNLMIKQYIEDNYKGVG